MIEKLVESINTETLVTKIVEYVPRLLIAVVLLVVFWVLASAARRVLAAALGRAKVPREAQNLLLRFTRYAVLIIGALTILDQLGVNIMSLVAGIGIAGLAVSFAAQDTIANLISGVTLVIDRPFKEGDWISMGDLHAHVTECRLRTTVLTTFDNETVVMPNNALAQERIVNYSLTPRIRIRVPIGIAYKENTVEARRVLLQTIVGDDRVLADPEPVVVITDLGDSSVNLQLRFWTEDPLQKFPLLSEYTEKCKHALDEAGIQIPFPHCQVFIERSQDLSAVAEA